MGMNQEEWLASHTKFCQPLHLRLTPSACHTLRTRTWNVKFGEDYVGGTPSACTNCPGLQDADTPTSSSASEHIRVTYTVDQLAALVGTTKKIVHNARAKFKSGKKSQGGAAGNVQAWLEVNGVEWKDVMQERKISGRKP